MTRATAVFLTTCSKSKVGGGPHGRPNCNMVPDSLLKARNSLYNSLTKGEPQKLRGAVQGPDFIRDSNGAGFYLPAHVRYARGQFMTSLEAELKEALDLWFHENRLVFISGLYGIVDASEPIQNYDVELEGLAEGYWRENRNALTDCLRGFLEEGSILLDCCGEPRYSDLIDWQDIEQRGFQVFHAIDRLREGGQIRAETGFRAANINAEMLEKIKNGCELEGVNAVIKFVGTSEFLQVRTGASGHLPQVGVIETGRDESSRVAREAARQGWSRHFNFKSISTPEALASSYRDGVAQCICLIPLKDHKHLVEWGGGKHPKEVFGGELLMVKHPIDLVLRFSA